MTCEALYNIICLVYEMFDMRLLKFKLMMWKFFVFISLGWCMMNMCRCEGYRYMEFHFLSRTVILFDALNSLSFMLNVSTRMTII